MIQPDCKLHSGINIDQSKSQVEMIKTYKFCNSSQEETYSYS